MAYGRISEISLANIRHVRFTVCLLWNLTNKWNETETVRKMIKGIRAGGFNL